MLNNISYVLHTNIPRIFVVPKINVELNGDIGSHVSVVDLFLNLHFTG
jgi:hypothetical protein